MPDLTILTPIAPHHLTLFAHCESSALNQTIPVLHFAMLDQHGRGPAYIRNRLLEKVKSPFVAFLDADDWLEPAFAEECLRYIDRGRFPVYSDWYQEGRHVKAHTRPWCVGAFHLITAIYPTNLVRSVGGFDEELRGMEDSDLALKVMARGVCGLRVPKPLVNYRKGGGRSHVLHETGEIDAIKAEIDRRYGGVAMGCCGGKLQLPDTPIGTQQPGDVLAMALWGGNREQMGLATGRRYPRTGNRKQVWVDPRDIAAAPHHWQQVYETVDMSELPEEGADSDLRGVAALVEQLEHAGRLKPAPIVVTKAPPIGVTPTPDYARVKALAMQFNNEDVRSVVLATEDGGNTFTSFESTFPAGKSITLPSVGVPTATPIFVMPERTYPSYSDFWRLVELAGFEVCSPYEVSDRNRTYIFTGPDGIADCSKWGARTIFWQLEYVGDYTEQANLNTVSEVWSSDPDHARRTGAKYVLLGSDRRLNPQWAKQKPKPQYDIVTLAYLTDRRRALYDQLRDRYTFTPDYPGHDGDKRHDILRRSRLMLHVHQHDTPAHTPLRYALAAAYRIDMISESTPDNAPFLGDILWSEYEDLAEVTQQYLDGEGFDLPTKYKSGEMLYHHLCIEHPFAKCVEEALHA